MKKLKEDSKITILSAETIREIYNEEIDVYKDKSIVQVEEADGMFIVELENIEAKKDDSHLLDHDFQLLQHGYNLAVTDLETIFNSLNANPNFEYSASRPLHDIKHTVTEKITQAYLHHCNTWSEQVK